MCNSVAASVTSVSFSPVLGVCSNVAASVTSVPFGLFCVCVAVWLLASLLLLFWPVLGVFVVWLLASLLLFLWTVLGVCCSVAACITSVPFGLFCVRVVVWLIASLLFLWACPGCV